jgi:hypothetical protein
MPFAADAPLKLLQVRSSIGLNLGAALGAALPLLALPLVAPPQVARAEGFGAMVQAMCLTVFESEMTKAGKVAPEGMAGFACRCVADRITQGNGVEEARRQCRLATMQRFPI